MPRRRSSSQLQVGSLFKFHLFLLRQGQKVTHDPPPPTCAGHLHVQMKEESGESAFTSTFWVPLSRWCQISVAIEGATVSDERSPGSSQVVK